MVDILKPISIIMEDGQRFTGLFSLTQDENAVLIGEGAPSIPPNYIGQGYLARSTKQFYTGNNLGQWVPLSIGTSSSGVFSLMSDVDFSNLEDQQEIKYVASTGKWVNFTPSTTGGSGATILDELDDVYIDSEVPPLGSTLWYQTGINQWVNKELTLDLLLDVGLGTSITAPVDGDYLTYSGTQWTNTKGTYKIFVRETSIDTHSVSNNMYIDTTVNIDTHYYSESVDKVSVSGVVGRSTPGYVYLNLRDAFNSLETPGMAGLCVVYVASDMDLVPFHFEYSRPNTGSTYTYTLMMHSGSNTETAYIGRRGIDDTIKVATNIFLDTYADNYYPS
jgi:hypothetical protein